MAKKVTLSVGERVYSVNLFNEYKGNLEGLAQILEDVKLIAIDPKEKEKIGYKVVEKGNGQATLTWDPKKSKDKEFELSDTGIKYLVDTLNKKDEKGEFTIADSGIMELKEKLEKAH